MSTTTISPHDTDAQYQAVRPAIFQLPGRYLVALIDTQLTERVIWRIETIPTDIFNVWRDEIIAGYGITDQAALSKIRACMNLTAAGRRDTISALAEALRKLGSVDALPLYASFEEAQWAMQTKKDEVSNG